MASTTGGERWLRVDSTAESTVGKLNGSPTWDPIRVRDGGFGVTANRQTVETLEQANTTTQPAPLTSHMEPGGPIAVIPSPHDSSMNFGGSPTKSAFRWLLDAFVVRTSGVLSSYSMDEVQNDVVTQQFRGGKCDGLEMSVSDGRLSMSTTWRYLHMGRATTALGTGASSAFPSSRDWLVRGMGFELGAQKAQGAAFSSVDTTLTAFTISGSNNLTSGSPTRWYPASGEGANETERWGIADLTEGELSMNGTVTIRSQDATYFDMLHGDTKGEIRAMMFHPDSNTATPSDASDVTLNTSDTIAIDTAADPSSDIVAGDVCYIEDHDPASYTAGTWPRGVHYVNTSDATSVTVDGDGSDHPLSLGRGQSIDATGGTGRIYSLGCLLWIPEIVLEDLVYEGSVRDKVEQTWTYRSQIKSGLSAALSVSPMNYMVR